MPLPSRLTYKSAELIENSDDELEMEPVDAINLPSQCVTIKSPPVADEPEVEKEHDNPDSRPGSPLPSTHNGRKKRKRTDTVQANETTTQVPVPKITYQLKLAEKPELEKQPSKRKNQVRILTLSADLDWDSLKAQILVKIDECLKPRALDFGNYDVCFTVPRKVSDPTPLGTDEDYEFLRTNVLKMSEKTAHIYICTRKNVATISKASKKVAEKENRREGKSSSSASDSSDYESGSDSGNEKKKKRKRKKKDKAKTRKDLDKGKKEKALPLNNAVVEKVKLLRERWQCSAGDGSEHCYW